jgi:hypothetical protein
MLFPKLIPTGTSYVRIPLSKRAAMRVILETVQRGSRYWIGGTVPIEKALAFATKMAKRYGTDATQAQRAYAKQQGRANTHLVMFPDQHEQQLRYWLLATPGNGAIHTHEKLLDTHQRREALHWADQYRLDHVQRPREHGGGRTWTWSLTEQRYAELEASMIQYASAPGRVQERGDDLHSLVTAILRMPGFYGVRQQQMQLLRLGQQRWDRTHGSETYSWPERVSYVDKHFNCYHVPEPLRLDVLVTMMERRRAVEGLSPGWRFLWAEDVADVHHSKSQSSFG